MLARSVSSPRIVLAAAGSALSDRTTTKLTCEPDLSVVPFLPGLALVKTTVLESIRTLSYFRLDTLTEVKVH